MSSFYPKVLLYAFRTQSVPSHLRKAMYIAAVKYGGEKEWEFFWRKYKQCKNAAQREKIITALGSAKGKQLLHRYGVYQSCRKTIFVSCYQGHPPFFSVKHLFGRWAGPNIFSNIRLSILTFFLNRIPRYFGNCLKRTWNLETALNTARII